MPKRRNAEKTALLLMRLIGYVSGKPGKSRKYKYESPYKYDKYSREAWQLRQVQRRVPTSIIKSTAGMRGNRDKYGGRV